MLVEFHLSEVVVVVVVVNFIKHQNRAITGERVAARAAFLQGCVCLTNYLKPRCTALK